MSDIALTVIDGRITTTSTQIAEHFGKRHDRVLRAIDNLECSPEFRLPNFGETVESRANPSGGAPIQSRAFTLTRDGFVFLCMGFTGREAAQWKEKYIAAFNAMEAELHAAPKVGAGGTARKGRRQIALRERLTPNLKQRINRKTHEIALRQYDTIHAFITRWADDNLACGASEADCESYIETAGELADGTVLINIRDAQELVTAAANAIDAAGSAMAAIKRIEQRSGHQFYYRGGRSPHTAPDFHAHDRLVEEVIDRIAGTNQGK